MALSGEFRNIKTPPMPSILVYAQPGCLSYQPAVQSAHSPRLGDTTAATGNYLTFFGVRYIFKLVAPTRKGRTT